MKKTNEIITNAQTNTVNNSKKTKNMKTRIIAAALSLIAVFSVGAATVISASAALEANAVKDTKQTQQLREEDSYMSYKLKRIMAPFEH